MATSKVFTGGDMDLDSIRSDENNTEETPQEEVVEPVVENEEEIVEEQSDQPSIEDLQAENLKLQQRYDNANQLIGRHSQELAQLREFQKKASQTPEDLEKTNESFLDDFVKDPQKALASELEKRETASAQQRQYDEGIASQNSNFVYQQVPAMDNLKDTILELAKEDGIENPTMSMLDDTIKSDPLLAVSYAKRAVLKQKFDDLQDQGNETIKKIARNSKKSPTIKSGAVKTDDTLSSRDIRNMSSKDIEARLKELNFYG